MESMARALGTAEGHGRDETVAAEPPGVRDHLPRQVRRALDATSPTTLIDAHQVAATRARFDDAQAEALTRYLGNSQSANTVRAYRGDWAAWLAWCASESKVALPADPLDVAVYLACAADVTRPNGTAWAFAPSTLERKAAAIAAVHAAAGLPSPTRADVVRLTLRGIRRSRGSRPTRKRPVLLAMLAEMVAQPLGASQAARLAHRRDALLLLIGFAGALRRSELAAISFDDVRVDVDERSGEPVLIVRLAATKTDPTGAVEQWVALPRGQRTETCPVCAFATWSDVLEAIDRGGSGSPIPRPDDADEVNRSAVHRCRAYRGSRLADGSRRPLFPAISRHGRVGLTAISGRAVSELIKRYASRVGLDPAEFGGHSLRAGFATQAALGGASDREIMRQGRWVNPTTVHRYIRTANPLDDNAVTKLGL